MRILHTSDWHLGQHFYGKSRAAEHAALIDWTLQQVSQHQVDALILAGDIFDSATPPSYARELYYRLVQGMAERNTTLVILAGNHDSVAVLEESQQLLRSFGTLVIAKAQSEPDQQLFTLRNRQGEEAAILCAIPYLRPRDLLVRQAGESLESKAQNLAQAIAQHYQQLYQQACLLREQSKRPLPIIATGHLTTLNSQRSDSVRDIYIGSLEAFDAGHFPPFDYLALGHIHRPQQVGDKPHFRYSGSPLALSFDEARQTKSMVLQCWQEGQPQAAELIPIPCWQPLWSWRGDLQQLPQALAAVDWPSQPLTWLDLQIEDQHYLSDLASRVEEILAPYPLELLRLRRVQQQQRGISQDLQLNLQELSPLQVFTQRLQQETLSAERQASLTTLFCQLLQEVSEEQDASTAENESPCA
ncbi:exonuclease subunit SbcD [Balneatrix alpica]|uniref:Nuclease SbcCD subunit D n=1 Tax=Balneatrix alpica TaxID=75684 RepID=A0ABV5Z7B0_9GAMM|nr:exonuclease subunit SbcD [Balneatrix alpica]